SLEKIADIYLQKGEVEKALTNYKKCLELFEFISKKRADSIEAKRDVSVSYYNIAKLHKESYNISDALKYYQKALDEVAPFRDYPYGDFKNMIKFFSDEIAGLKKN
ncbi:MAG: tetratricopeptide repeat protein, partial [Sulfurovum sp.]